MTLAELDKNMAFKGITSQNLRWYDRHTPEFSFDGCNDLENFHRINMEKDLPKMPEGIQYGYRSTGITLRFRTNATTIALKSVLWIAPSMPIMPLAGSHGFDLYLADAPEEGAVSALPRYRFPIRPEPNEPTAVGGEYKLRELDHPGTWHDVEIGFPLYNGVLEFELGLNPEASLLPPSRLAKELPVVFYGSSITQGAAASRPGNCYTTMLARTLRLPQINLGFSGRAKGEPEMAAYIASLSMCAFVMDYDHNADTPSDLEATHEPFFKIVRKAQPNLPIILISRPNSDMDPADADKRFAIIEKTYKNALAAGDKNVYLVDGRKFFEEDQRDSCTVDGAHPTDLGFYRMYHTIRPVLEKALQL